MKTTINIKKALHIVIVSALIISSVIIIKKIIKTVKHEYSMLPAGSGKSCFYDIIQ